MPTRSATLHLVYTKRPRPSGLAGLSKAALFDVSRPLAGLILGLGMAVVSAQPEITYNNDRAYKSGKKAADGIEIRFGGKVSDEVVEKLKAAGFRFSSKQKMWYNLNTMESRAFVEQEIAEAEFEVDDAPTKTVNFWVVAKSVAELWKQSKNTWYKVEGKIVKGKAALQKYGNARLESSVNTKKVHIMIFRDVPVDSDGTAIDPATAADPTSPSSSAPVDRDLAMRHKAWAAKLEYEAQLLAGDINPDRIKRREVLLQLAGQHNDETKWENLDRSFWGRVQTARDAEELLQMNSSLTDSLMLDRVRQNIEHWAELTTGPQFDMTPVGVVEQSKTILRVIDDPERSVSFLLRLRNIEKNLLNLQNGQELELSPRPPAAPAKLPAAVQSMLHQDIATRLRLQGDALTKQIDAKLNSGTSKQRYTARRGRIAAGMAADGMRLKDQQDMLYALATMHDTPAWHPVLEKMHLLGNIRKRTEVEAVLSIFKEKNNLYVADRLRNNADYWAGLLAAPGGTPSDELKLQRAFQAMQTGDDLSIATYQLFQQAEKVIQEVLNNAPPKNQAVADAVAEVAKREAENKLRNLDVPGFFPTPPTLIDKLLLNAQIKPGDVVLEPSAGKGDIADAIRARHPDAQLELCEINYTLRTHLAGKGYTNIKGDFLEVEVEEKYDVVVMNPPFENGADIQHVMHAFKMLKPGGRLTAIMGEGAFVNSYHRNKEFAEFLGFSMDTMRTTPALYGEDQRNDPAFPKLASIERNPPDAFINAFNSTGVRTRTIWLTKVGAPKPAAAPVATDDAARLRARALVLLMKMRARALTLDAETVLPAASLSGAPRRSQRLGLRASLLGLKSSIVTL